MLGEPDRFNGPCKGRQIHSLIFINMPSPFSPWIPHKEVAKVIGQSMLLSLVDRVTVVKAQYLDLELWFA